MSSTIEEFYRYSHLSGGNAAFVEAYYEDWLNDPDSVPQQWRKVFDAMPGANGTERGHLEIQERFRMLQFLDGSTSTGGDTAYSDHKQAGVLRLVNAFRVRGHENARLDPLGSPHHPPVADLELEAHDLDQGDLDREFDTGTLFAPERMSLRDIYQLCKRVYTGSIGVEYMHIVDTDKRRWLQERLEGTRGEYQVSDPERLRILRMLTAAEGLEKFL
ncbi:MAG: 2-oxoglutarate dehydrogenase E1 component, partial [Xanthomonadales bacterium]|nr:2-oxoglutarate dehydrogenase E1 component [Xanthomonadales bacterium]